MRTLTLYGAWLKRTGIEFRRYYFETISMIVTLYGFFLVIFLGARAFAGGSPGFGDTMSGLVVGYMLWTAALYAYFAMAQGVVDEAQVGTLEQLAMSPHGLVRILMAQVTGGLVYQFGVMAVILVMMMASTGRWLHLDLVSIVPLLVVTLVSVIGLGFVAAGLALVFKRVQSALQILQVALLALVVTPVDTVPVVKYLPMAWGASLLRRVMVEESSIFEIPAGDHIFLLANSAFYLVAGMAVFVVLERVARDRALLGHY